MQRTKETRLFAPRSTSTNQWGSRIKSAWNSLVARRLFLVGFTRLITRIRRGYAPLFSSVLVVIKKTTFSRHKDSRASGTIFYIPRRTARNNNYTYDVFGDVDRRTETIYFPDLLSTPISSESRVNAVIDTQAPGSIYGGARMRLFSSFCCLLCFTNYSYSKQTTQLNFAAVMTTVGPRIHWYVC